MDPISNKKEFEDLTAILRDLAYAYIEKYHPSKQQIKIYLLKKYLKKFQGSKAKKEISKIIRKHKQLIKIMVLEAREYRKSIPHVGFHPHTWYHIIFQMDICGFIAKT